MNQYFLKSYECFGGKLKVEFNLTNYATKGNVKGATGVIHLL